MVIDTGEKLDFLTSIAGIDRIINDQAFDPGVRGQLLDEIMKDAPSQAQDEMSSVIKDPVLVHSQKPIDTGEVPAKIRTMRLPEVTG